MGVQHTARHELEGEGFTVHDDAVSGVVAALVADDHRHLAGHEIREPALALIAPLRPDNDGRWHGTSPGSRSLTGRAYRRYPVASECFSHPLRRNRAGPALPDPGRFRGISHVFPSLLVENPATAMVTPFPLWTRTASQAGSVAPCSPREPVRNSRSTRSRVSVIGGPCRW